LIHGVFVVSSETVSERCASVMNGNHLATGSLDGNVHASLLSSECRPHLFILSSGSRKSRRIVYEMLLKVLPTPSISRLTGGCLYPLRVITMSSYGICVTGSAKVLTDASHDALSLSAVFSPDGVYVAASYKFDGLV